MRTLLLVLLLTGCASAPQPRVDRSLDPECYMVFDAKMRFLGCMVGPMPQ